MINLHSLDWAVFSLILIITIVFVIYGNKILGRKEQDPNSIIELLIMGRQLTLPLFIATLVATWYGGIFGVAQIAFESGIYNLITQGLFWYISYLIFAFFIFDRVKKYEAITLPNLLEKMIGPKAATLGAWFNILNLLPIAYCISIGQLLHMFLGIDLFTGSLLGAGFVVSYSMFGGMRSVVFSDLVQFFVMVSAVVIVFLLSLFTYGLGPLQQLPDHYFSISGNTSLAETFLWGLLALATLIDPNFYQRAFAAQSEKVVKKGIVISTIIWMIFDISLTFGAMYARALMPDVSSSHGYFIFSIEMLPIGLKGFFLAGIVATILSTMDSYLFLAGTTISYDLLPKKFREKKLTHSLCILIVAIIAVILSRFFDGSIKSVWKLTGSLLTAGLLLPTLAAYMNDKFKQEGVFLTASFAGIVSTLLWVLSGMNERWGVDGLYAGSLASSLVLLISYFRPITNYSNPHK